MKLITFVLDYLENLISEFGLDPSITAGFYDKKTEEYDFEAPEILEVIPHRVIAERKIPERVIAERKIPDRVIAERIATERVIATTPKPIAANPVNQEAAPVVVRAKPVGESSFFSHDITPMLAYKTVDLVSLNAG